MIDWGGGRCTPGGSGEERDGNTNGWAGGRGKCSGGAADETAAAAAAAATTSGGGAPDEGAA